MVHSFKSGYVNISAWGMFSARGRSILVQLKAMLNQPKYKTMLDVFVLPSMKTSHSGDGNFIYQHDG